MVVFSDRPLINILKYRSNSSDSESFWTTTGIQSGPDAFDKSMLVVNFLTNLGVIETLCSFQLL